jgi:hypothetical protein
LKTEQIYSEWISAVDLTKTRIVQFPSFIFLCGGRISENQNQFLSCRDIFYSYINRNGCSFRENVVLAEKIFEYFDHSDYQDLLHFERDLAELSSLTVIFSESPGSIAELGSFAVLNTIQDRLLVVMHQDDTHQESFIWRGPVSFLKNLAKENGNDDPISIYNWKKKRNDDCSTTIEDFSDAIDLSETIESAISKLPKTVSFNKKQLGHIMLLIISSLKIVHLATLEEIIFLLKGYSIDVDQKSVKQYLSLLKSLSLIVLKPYRNYEFYLAAPQNDWISWGYYTETARNRDADRWANQFVDFYDTNQKEKYRALRSYLKSTGQVGD